MSDSKSNCSWTVFRHTENRSDLKLTVVSREKRLITIFMINREKSPLSGALQGFLAVQFNSSTSMLSDLI